MGRCAVIIVNWNSWDILFRCLERLQNQTFRNFSVMVIDNASNQEAPREFFTRYPNVSLVQNLNNVGFASANNQAIKLLEDSKWLALLNPDAFPEPDWLEKLFKATNENPDFVMFASRQLMDADGNLLDGDGDAYHLSGRVWRINRGRNLMLASKKSREVFSPCAAAALYRRDVLESVGGFDEDFFCYVEDVDLGFRLRLMGHRCLLVPDAVVHHIGSATTGGQQSDFSVYHGHRNLVWAYVKNMPGWLFWACLPLHIAMNLVAVVLFVWQGKGRVIFRAKRDALLGLPKMWRKRHRIQNERIATIAEIWRVLDKQLLPTRKER